MLTIREERPPDVESIGILNRAAFGTETEARLVEALRNSEDLVLSLVALEGDALVGHLLLSAAQIVSDGHRTRCVVLAPMAVAPDKQRSGIGSKLVEHALDQATQAGHAIVSVLGHADYYPRFGFVPAGPYGITCPFPCPPEAWMVKALRPDALDGVRGELVYPAAFADVG